jgi:hypothetical protein
MGAMSRGLLEGPENSAVSSFGSTYIHMKACLQVLYLDRRPLVLGHLFH